ncbi:MAG: ThiF family adenylyltransferase [Acidobacteriota bacterium]|nr:ThiF family adenylyltransferase [Acidobacteriota bacterium]
MRKPSENSARSLIVVGAGGNIGSHLVPHLGRMRAVEQVTLIDRDVYEQANLYSQCITPIDVGKSKADVQARILRRINPQLQVTAIKTGVENLPLGRLRADLILACLDTRGARQYVNQAAWRLGMPWIDAGVEAGGLLARINVYLPGPDNPCLECAWDHRDYDALEQTYPCVDFVEEAFPTNAPSSLGALAASLQAIECEKLLTGRIGRVAVSQQVLIDAAHHKHYVTAFRRNPYCRFSNHQVWSIEKLDRRAGELTIGQALGLGRCGTPGQKDSPGLRVEGKRFVRKLICGGCGRTKSLLCLKTSLRASQQTCAVCGHALVTAGPDLLERLNATVLSQRQLGRTLASIGIRRGEVLSIGDRSGETHFEICGDARA